MIATVFKIAVLRLWNNKQELLLTFIVPVLFFSIFALIFSRGIGSGATRVKVSVVDDDQSRFTEQVLDTLDGQEALEIQRPIRQTNVTWPIGRLAREILQKKNTAVVVHFPNGLESSLHEASAAKVHLLREGTSPVASEMVNAMLAQAIASSIGQSSSVASPLVGSPPARHRTQRVQSVRPVHASGAQEFHRPLYRLPNTSHRVATSNTPAVGPNVGMIEFESTDVFEANKHNPKTAMYAAGIAVMFLLFSASGAGGSLLDEYEAGTLDRLLTSQLTLTKLLMGKWLFITTLGFVQLTVMFVWAQIAFGVDFVGHVPGFLVMAFCTASATASLALCLAVFCKTRNQLNGVSVVLILTMSALGGSMVPRYIMSEEMQRLGKLTFNGWALDGFKKVFWYDLPVSALTHEVAILVAMAIYLAVVARVFADRWTAT